MSASLEIYAGEQRWHNALFTVWSGLCFILFSSFSLCLFGYCLIGVWTQFVWMLQVFVSAVCMWVIDWPAVIPSGPWSVEMIDRFGLAAQNPLLCHGFTLLVNSTHHTLTHTDTVRPEIQNEWVLGSRSYRSFKAITGCQHWVQSVTNNEWTDQCCLLLQHPWKPLHTYICNLCLVMSLCVCPRNTEMRLTHQLQPNIKVWVWL